MRTHGDNCEAFEQQDSLTEDVSKGTQREWDDSRDFIDAGLHEELIWMEAAVACDGCADANTRCSEAAPSCSECSDDLGARGSGSSHAHSVCNDADDWYSVEIEAQILKLEQQRNEIADAQVVFEDALLHYVHGPNCSSNER
jgi:hypothetical protein